MLTLIRVPLFILVISEFILTSCATSKNLGGEFDDLYYSGKNPTKSLNAEDKRETDINNIEGKEVPTKRLVVNDSLKRINIKNKNYLGVFGGGVAGIINHKNFNSGLGYGGSLGITVPRGGTVDCYVLFFNRQPVDISGLPEAEELEWNTIGIVGDFYLTPNWPVKPYLQTGMTFSEYDVSSSIPNFGGFLEGTGFTLGTGVEVCPSRFISFYLEVAFRKTNVKPILILGDDFSWAFSGWSKGIQGGLRLIIPFKTRGINK
jgi:opacity protein-like surface antigen